MGLLLALVELHSFRLEDPALNMKAYTVVTMPM